MTSARRAEPLRPDSRQDLAEDEPRCRTATRQPTPEEEAEAAALSLARSVLGREPAAEEAEAMSTIMKAATQALRHGFIRRLAEHVVAERTDESVEEFFENVIHPD